MQENLPVQRNSVFGKDDVVSPNWHRNCLIYQYNHLLCVKHYTTVDGIIPIKIVRGGEQMLKKALTPKLSLLFVSVLLLVKFDTQNR